MLEYDIAEYSQISPDLYRRELRKLQAEFLKLQRWVIQERKRLLLSLKEEIPRERPEAYQSYLNT